MKEKMTVLVALLLIASALAAGGLFIRDRHARFVMLGDEIGITISLDSYNETLIPYYNQREDLNYFFAFCSMWRDNIQ